MCHSPLRSPEFTFFFLVTCLQGIAGPAGTNGKPGPPGPRGEKGDSAASELEALKKEVSSLTGRLNSQQSKIEKYDKEIAAIKKQASTLNGRVNSLQSKLEKHDKVFTFIAGAKTAGDKIYVSKGEQANYNDAKAACTKAKGELPSPQNVAENEAVQSFIKLYKIDPFLGINDLKTEGTFTYPNGEKLKYTNWKDGEPNDNFGVEDCVEMYDTGKWNDKNCNEKRLIICEF
ncbi:hypothetical protein GDO81_004571 [Engystomops pustulosus]|uniref:C-type lectin domain-containing protein n=1 Tax=Engystomops pustulosus TaxID=76066 RepID=A0AAV6ZZ39_ENGPU|nr:hypothetical protein GDO81_004571 [Engystomops pustulosus]